MRIFSVEKYDEDEELLTYKLFFSGDRAKEYRDERNAHYKYNAIKRHFEVFERIVDESICQSELKAELEQSAMENNQSYQS